MNSDTPQTKKLRMKALKRFGLRFVPILTISTSVGAYLARGSLTQALEAAAAAAAGCTFAFLFIAFMLHVWKGRVV